MRISFLGARAHFLVAFTVLTTATLALGLAPPPRPAAAAACPCTIWSSSTVPGTLSDPDSSAVELGVKFQADVSGFITGLRPAPALAAAPIAAGARSTASTRSHPRGGRRP